MKKIKVISVFYVFLLLLITCKQSEYEIRIIDSDIKAEILNGKIKFPIISRLAGDIKEIDSLLLIITPFEDGIFNLYSKSTGQLKYIYNMRGKGPGEFIQPYIGIFNQRLSFWDASRFFSEIYINLDNNQISFTQINSLTIEEGGTHTHRLNDKMIISTNIIGKGMFALYNNNGEIIGDYFGNSPIEGTQDYLPFQGNFAATDSGDLFVFGTSSLGYMCAYEFNEIEPRLKWELLFEKPYFTLENDRIRWDQERHSQGIKDIQIVDSNIFILYSGRSISLRGNTPEGAFSDNLYILNLDGDILKKYQLDIPIFKFTLSKTDSALYGITIEEDWHIVKYNFSDVFHSLDIK